MSEAQHTPGPWVADNFCEEDDRCTRVGTTDGSPHYYHRTATIAFVLTNYDDEDRAIDVRRIGTVEAEANARMIAAAPAVLGALQTARDYVADVASGSVRYEKSGEGIIEMAKEDLVVLDAAIASALGK